jgi:hypothetical protein
MAKLTAVTGDDEPARHTDYEARPPRPSSSPPSSRSAPSSTGHRPPGP